MGGNDNRRNTNEGWQSGARKRKAFLRHAREKGKGFVSRRRDMSSRRC